jgi:uncharacterized protein YggE
MRRTALLALPVAALVVVGYLVGTIHSPDAATAATSQSADEGVIVSGVGKVSGTPDVLRVQLGVEVHRVDVSTALRDANTIQNRVRAAVRGDGVDPKDMQTSDVSLYPSYNRRGVINGYNVSEMLTVKLRDLGHAGKTIGDAVIAGGNAARLQGVSFALEDNAALLEKARDAAYTEAKKKAERYAELSGRSLNRVELVSEQVPQGEQPMRYADVLAAGPMKSAEVPIDAGQAQVSVSVTVRWSLR